MPRPARPWFRYYSESLESRKAQRLKPVLFKHWINLMALANVTRPRGRLPAVADIAYAFRPMTEQQAAAVVSELQDLGFIDQEGAQMVMHDWDDWQKESDAGLTPGRSEKSETTRNPRDKNAESPRNPRETPALSPRKRGAEERRGETDKEKEGEEEGDARPRELFNVFRLCEQFYGRPLGTMEIQSLKDLEEEFDPECITHAFREASDLNKKSLRYVRRICERHKKEGCFVDLRPSATATDRGTGLATPAGPSWPGGYKSPDLLLPG